MSISEQPNPHNPSTTKMHARTRLTACLARKLLVKDGLDLGSSLKDMGACNGPTTAPKTVSNDHPCLSLAYPGVQT